MEQVKNDGVMKFVSLRDVAQILGTDAIEMGRLISAPSMSHEDRKSFADFVLRHKEDQA
jgi:hypothetical protein